MFCFLVFINVFILFSKKTFESVPSSCLPSPCNCFHMKNLFPSSLNALFFLLFYIFFIYAFPSILSYRVICSFIVKAYTLKSFSIPSIFYILFYYFPLPFLPIFFLLFSKSPFCASLHAWSCLASTDHFQRYLQTVSIVVFV